MPIHRLSPITGTTRADRLTARADGDQIFGFGGNDRLTSAFNATLLSGGAGNDRLTTDLSYGDENVTSASAEQSGGTGNDILNAGIYLANSTAGASISLLVGGGDGDDRINAYAGLEGNDQTALNRVLGGGGDDTIEAITEAAAGAEGTSVTNDVSGGAGDDVITATTQTAYSGAACEATNLVSGDDGDDIINATVYAYSNGSDTAANVVDGGTGNDIIRSVILSATNSSSTPASNEIDGGAGNDRITLSFSDGGDSSVDCSHGASGGTGNDRITSVIDASTDAYYLLNISTWLDGGDGNDRLVARTSGGLIDGGSIASGRIVAENELSGGAGRDTLRATLDIHTDTDSGTFANLLRGGGDDDTLVAQVLDRGASSLYGDAGNDRLTVVGGTGNALYGGSGLDRLVAGDGDDTLSGGADADSFVFDAGLPQGSDTLTDFDGAEDILVFLGLADSGTAGLADDLDAQSTITDQGSGLDIIVTFDNGTVLTFEGLGTGDTDSFADLVTAPLTQLVSEPL